jgi:hypothetical protein
MVSDFLGWLWKFVAFAEVDLEIHRIYSGRQNIPAQWNFLSWLGRRAASSKRTNTIPRPMATALAMLRIGGRNAEHRNLGALKIHERV